MHSRLTPSSLEDITENYAFLEIHKIDPFALIAHMRDKVEILDNNDSVMVVVSYWFSLPRDRPLITGRGVLQNGKIVGPPPFVKGCPTSRDCS